MYILVLESSTTSAKAMLYDTDAKAYTVESEAYKILHGDVTQNDAEDVFLATAKLGRQLCEGKSVDAIVLSGTWHSVMLCDRDMRPQTPAYNWSYTGAAGICKELRGDEEYVLRYYHKTGNMVNAIYPYFKLKLLREQGYVLENHRILGQGTYNTYRFTGEWVVTDSMLSGSGLMNTHQKDYDNELLGELGITRENVGRLVRYNESLTLSREGAELLGLQVGIPVLPTMPDGALNQVGSGALEPGVMTFSVGTSGAIRLTTDRPVIPEQPSTWCYLSPTSWLSGAATSGCCNCIDWYKERFFGVERSYREIEEHFRPSGAPVVFLPFLFGERCPGWDDERVAAFCDVKPHHNNYDLYHAVHEGVLFNLYQCYGVLTALNGVPKKIKLSGGILNSPYWMQMCVDIFGTTMEIDTAKHSSMIGAVVIGMERLGLVAGLSDIEVQTAREISPDPDKAPMYNERYRRYLYWYDKLKDKPANIRETRVFDTSDQTTSMKAN